MSDRPRDRRASAGAWAAAALVLALGGLGFGVAAHLRLTDQQKRIDRLEAERPARAGETPNSQPAGASSPSSTTTSSTSTTAAPSEPPNPAQAQTLIAAAFTTVYDGQQPNTSRLAMIDDPTGVEAALEAAAVGPSAPLLAAAHATVAQITFTSATRSTVSYSVDVTGQAPSPTRQGEARLSGGTWKVTRDTVCLDLKAIGAPCNS